MGEYQYPWREKLAKYKDELSKGVWGYWELGAWKPLAINARRRARLRKEVLLAGADWEYDQERKEMRTKRKGHKVDRLAAEKREHTAELMEAMPQMLVDYRKRRWERKMKAEDRQPLIERFLHKQAFHGQPMGNTVPAVHYPPAVRPRIRARRGQATDPHSIAERTDRAVMLDEIVDYVKFLKLQVKFTKDEYSQAQIDEMRFEWAECVQEHI